MGTSHWPFAQLLLILYTMEQLQISSKVYTEAQCRQWNTVQTMEHSANNRWHCRHLSAKLFWWQNIGSSCGWAWKVCARTVEMFKERPSLYIKFLETCLQFRRRRTFWSNGVVNRKCVRNESCLYSIFIRGFCPWCQIYICINWIHTN